MHKVKKHCVTGLLVALGVSLSAVSQAQSSPFSLRLGTGTFTDRDYRRGTNDNGFLIGIGYNLASLLNVGPTPGQASINFDFMRGGDEGNLSESMSLTYEVRWSFGGTNTNFMPYWGLGFGVFRGHYEMTLEGGGGGGGGGGSRPTRGAGGGGGGGGGPVILDQTFVRPGGKVIVGAKLSDRFFVESTYRLAGQSRGFVTDSINFLLGIQF